MKIAILTTSYFPEYNGASIRVDGLAEGLRAYGHKVVVIAPGNAFTRNEYPHCTVYSIPVQQHYWANALETLTKFHAQRYRSFLTHVCRIIEREGIEVIHTRQPLDLFSVGKHCKKRYGILWAVEVHKLLSVTDYENGSIGHFRYSRLLRMERKLINNSDLVVTMTASGKQTLTQFGITTPIVAVANASSLSLKRSTADPAKKLEPYLLYVGNIRDAERLDRLLSAFQIISSKHAGIHLVIIGGGDQKKLEKEARRLGLIDSVNFLGELPYSSLAPYYKHALLFVQPRTSIRYHRDIIGLKMYDALRAGLPIATSDFGELGALIKELDVGVLSNVDDDHDFAEKVVALLKDRKAYRALLKRARAAQEMFTWKKSCGPLHQAYTQLTMNLNKPRSRQDL